MSSATIYIDGAGVLTLGPNVQIESDGDGFVLTHPEGGKSFIGAECTARSDQWEINVTAEIARIAAKRAAEQ